MQKVDSLNPFRGFNDSAHIFYGLVYDYLICLDEDLQPKPNLAVSWDIVEDHEPYGSVWQYNLTHNAYWHDGEPVDADDVVFTFNYQIDEKWVAMWANQPYTLLVSSVEKVDDYTVRLHFAKDGEPVACSFGDSLMLPIIPEHYWKDIHYIDAGFSHANPKPIGSGPFMCTDDTYDEFLRGDGLILYKHEHYHGAAEYGKEIQFDVLVLDNYLEPAALLADLQSGAVDIAQLNASIYMSLVDWLEENPTAAIHAHADRKCTGYSVEIGICMKPDAPGQNNLRLDPSVRQAMAHATDKDLIVDHVYRGLAEAGSTILSPVYPEWYWEPEGDEVYGYDIDRADEILDDAGYVWNNAHTVRYAPEGHPWNNVVEDLELRFDMIIQQEMIEDRATGEILVEEWAEVGIIIEPVYVDTDLWGTLVYGGMYELMLTHWSGDPDPNYLLYTQTTEALDGWSENWHSSPAYDENYTMSVLEVDPEERLQYVKNCQRIMYENAAFIVMAYPYECAAWRTDHFSGWGDWVAHPGRALSNCWTANDLYFDLAPIGNSPPSTTAEVEGALGENGWYRSNVTVTLMGSDDSGSVNRTQYSFDGSGWFIYDDPFEIASEGVHTVEYYSVDDTGLCEPHETLEVAIDTIDPSVLIDSEDGAIFTTNEVNISWASSDSGSGVDVLEFSIDGEEYVSCDDSYVVLTDMDDGEHSLVIRAHDAAGNNASDTLQFEVDVSNNGTSGLILIVAAAAAIVIAVAAITYLIVRRKPEPPPAQ